MPPVAVVVRLVTVAVVADSVSTLLTVLPLNEMFVPDVVLTVFANTVEPAFTITSPTLLRARVEKLMCAVSAVSVAVLEVDSIRNAAASDVNFNYQALSNVAMVQTPVITTAGANISLDGKTLSNALAISTAMITSDNANIDVDSKVLSNVLAIETPSITSATTAAVQFTGKGLSNLGDVLLNAGSTLKANTITTTDGRANIDLSTRGRPWS